MRWFVENGVVRWKRHVWFISLSLRERNWWYLFFSSFSSNVHRHLPDFYHCPEEIDDITFLDIADSMNHNTDVHKLGIMLGLSRADVGRFKSENTLGPSVTSQGTQHMLYGWQRAQTRVINRWSALYQALIKAELRQGADILVNRARERECWLFCIKMLPRNVYIYF